MKEILMELEILRDKMEKSRIEFHMNSGEYDKDLKADNLKVDISFPELIFAITNRLKRSDLLEMTNQDFIRHIQYIQILES